MAEWKNKEWLIGRIVDWLIGGMVKIGKIQFTRVGSLTNYPFNHLTIQPWYQYY